MKKFAKITSVVLASAMVLASLAGCGSKEAADSTAADSSVVESAAEESSVEESAAESTAESEEAAESTASEEGTIVFGTNAEFPPFEFVTQEGVIGEYDGIDIAMAKAIAEDNGMEAEISNMEFDSLIIALQNGQIDACIAGMTVTEERAEAVDFSTPYYTATQVMIVKEGSDITKASDMEGKKIVVIQGYTGEVCVEEMGYDYEAFKKGTEAIMELLNGKCDVVVIDSATAEKYVADNEGLEIVEDSEAFGSEEYAIAVQKGNTELLDKINASVEKMVEDGTVNDLAAQYADADAE